MSHIANIKTWTTGAVPHNERFDYWRDVIVGRFQPLSVAPAGNLPFSGELELFEFDDMTLARGESGRYRTGRSRREVASIERNCVNLLCQTKGRSAVAQRGERVVLQANQTTILFDDYPFDLEFLGANNELLSVQIPFEALKARIPDLRKSVLTELTQHSAIGPSLAHLIMGLPAAIKANDPKCLSILRYTLLDMVEVALRERRARHESTAGISQHIDSMLIKRFMDSHLSDPDLTPARVAEALSISERTVHSRFAAMETTFMSYLRQQRLDRIAKRIVSPQPPKLSDLIFEMGFSYASTFNRAFRKEYGLSPREYRQRHHS